MAHPRVCVALCGAPARSDGRILTSAPRGTHPSPSPAQVITRALVFLYTTARHATQQLSPAGRPSLLRGVQPGLWPQSQVDLSDPQWRSFRHALPALCAAALLSALMARLVRAYLGRGGLLGHSQVVADSTPAAVAQLAAVRPASSLAFDVLVGVGFTGACGCSSPRVRNACAVPG